jgi:hypothetical protein
VLLEWEVDKVVPVSLRALILAVFHLLLVLSQTQATLFLRHLTVFTSIVDSCIVLQRHSLSTAAPHPRPRPSFIFYKQNFARNFEPSDCSGERVKWGWGGEGEGVKTSFCQPPFNSSQLLELFARE